MMKRWSGILLLLFATLLWGCGGSHDARIVAVLDRADSLLRTSDTAAHSAALRQMVALDTAHILQSDEMLRARHALLLAQARYKCYVTEPADSGLMEIARNYYADHHSSAQDHERYTRALIYSGCVAEELGHPQQAMQYYLEAESTADPNDHFNLGYVNMCIAGIYESEYTTDSTDLVRYKQALPHFEKAGSDYYQAVCLTNIGGLYRTHNNDSAMHYLQQAISFSKEHGLTYNYYKSLDKLCGLYYVKEEYTKSRNLATQIYRESHGFYYGTQYLSFGIRSFAKLGMIDSAEYYFKLLPEPQSPVDSMMLHKTLSVIAEAKNDYKAGIANYRKSNEVADTIILKSNSELLKTIEQQYHTNQLKNETEKAKGNVWLLWTIIVLIALFSCYITYKFIRARNLMSQLDKENKMISKSLKDLQEKAKNLERQPIDSHQEKNGTIDLIDSEIAILTELSQKLSYPRKMSLKDVLFSKGISTKLSLKPLSPDFWNNLFQVADIKSKGIITYLNNNYDCKPKELKFIALVCFGFSNQIIQQCMDYSNVKTVSNYKSSLLKNITGENKSLDLFIADYMMNENVK
ncbi:MAG: hypothetical protein J5523_05405 [Muribaculaceae bacterium]|nr:hypothetical protein [Muribaculaceae bacterium]